jgi:HlyD family secretion protein
VSARAAGRALALLLLGACGGDEASRPSVQAVPVERRDIIVEVEATGVVEPINVVEVKSKASGQITRMPVETGSNVRTGDLLVQLDTRDVRNQYDQSLAAVRAAEARASVATQQKKRADDLFTQQIITAQEHESAALEFANAQAALVRARTDLDLAQQRLEDATVRAPVNGTVIEKAVSLGQVITSATGAFGGGTTLLKMADLDRVRVRALVNETDIGNVRAGQSATVTVDAYPDRPFHGIVEKIEPQAVVQQSVTMFPVLVTLANLEGFLKPGMNGEVAVLVERRTNVIAVPNDAVRNPREAAQAAQLLGLDPEVVRAQLDSQRAGANRTGSAGGRTGAVARTAEAAREVALTPASLTQDTAARRAGQRGRRRAAAAADTNGITVVQPPEGAPLGAPRARPGLVFVKADDGWRPRLVMLGVSNYDYSEVLRGLAEGEDVALLSAAALQARRQEQQNRIRGMGGVPGMQRQQPAAGGTGSGGAQRPSGGNR